MSQTNFVYGQDQLTIERVLALVRAPERGVLSPAVIRKVRASEQKVAEIVS